MNGNEPSTPAVVLSATPPSVDPADPSLTTENKSATGDTDKRPAPGGWPGAVGITGLVTLTIVAGWSAPAGANVIIVWGLMLLVMIVLGVTITSNPVGILINERNLMSLSRFQMATWTVAVLGAYFTFAIVRIKAQVPDPLAIQIDWHLWALMGISATSLVGTPLILSMKRSREPDDAALQKASRLVQEPKNIVDANREGTLYANTSLKDARFTDMFQGDEINNTAQIDLAKVQMFYFTLIVIVSFLVLVFKIVSAQTPNLGQLPLLPDGLIALAGISNAGYLASKSIDHTKTKQEKNEP